MATRFSGRGRIQRKTWCIGWDPMPELTITSPYVHSKTSWATLCALMPESTLTLQYVRVRFIPRSWSSDLASDYRTFYIGQSTALINKYCIYYRPKNDYRAQYSNHPFLIRIHQNKSVSDSCGYRCLQVKTQKNSALLQG
jgi:hypothetical protein